MGLMSIRIALRALARNRVRSALTMLGVVIGVAAVIAMVAIGQGATSSVQQQIASMGDNLLMIVPGSSSSGALMFGAGTVRTLTPDDAETILRDCPAAAGASVVIRARAQIVYQDQNWAPATVEGTDPSYVTVRNWEIAEGAWFTESDLRAAGQVCILGQTVVEQVFRGESPVGRRIRVNGMPFRVVGVLVKKGANAFGSDQDDTLLLPYTTVQKKLQGSAFDTIDRIFVSARAAEDLPELEQDVRRVLRANHRLDREHGTAAMDDFSIRNLTEVMGAMTSTTSIMTALLAAIASVSLLVGGIGIMNIMLVSVTERTREIGLRMAVGATSSNVLAQFLIEALVLSAIGGLIGIAVGLTGATTVARIAHWPVIVSPQAVEAAVLFSAAVGVVFGFYPAWRASRLDPMDALRYE
ncbi:MAG: ABC transporter permease [Planctomycetes bacterium]|nr:ABC transporter permease [Planctomycetota bacterium]